jgi:hypothetical protein
MLTDGAFHHSFSYIAARTIFFVASFTSTSTTLLDHHIHHASQERYVHLRIPSILTGRMQSMATLELRC